MRLGGRASTLLGSSFSLWLPLPGFLKAGSRCRLAATRSRPFSRPRRARAAQAEGRKRRQAGLQPVLREAEGEPHRLGAQPPCKAQPCHRAQWAQPRARETFTETAGSRWAQVEVTGLPRPRRSMPPRKELWIGPGLGEPPNRDRQARRTRPSHKPWVPLGMGLATWGCSQGKRWARGSVQGQDPKTEEAW